MEIFLSSLIGAATGIVSSYAVWWFVTRRMVPRVAFSEKISVQKDRDVHGRRVRKYRIKIHNSGLRAAVDVNARAIIRFTKTRGAGKGNVQLMEVGILTVPLPRLAPKQGRIMNLKTEMIPIHQRRHLTAEMIERLEKGIRVSIQEILKHLGSDAHVRIWVTCYDEFSGSRKVFISNDYQGTDFTNLGFDRNSEKIEAGGPR